MLSSLYLLWLAGRWLAMGAYWCVLAFVKWFVLMLLWCMSPQQALECFDEMEAMEGDKQKARNNAL